MRFTNALLTLCLLTAMPFISCEKDEEAEKVSLPGGGGTGGGGGGGGTGGGSGAAVTPGSIDITSEPIWSCGSGGTAYVLYDSTSWHSSLLVAGPPVSQAASQFGLGDVPYSGQVFFYGFTWSGADATQAEMDAYFTPGNKTFATGGSMNGVALSMTIDGSGDINSIFNSTSASQTGSFFTVTDVEPYDDGTGAAGIKLRAVWQCSMSNLAGTVKSCVDGVFVGYFTGNAI